uniref:RING-type domain-containing protein n=1 Tax=Globodera rostochiensis TaxID=31243 RepID=A0A914IF07_GLORO
MSDRLVKRKPDCASEEEVYGAEEETPPKNVAKHREQLQQFRFEEISSCTSATGFSQSDLLCPSNAVCGSTTVFADAGTAEYALDVQGYMAQHHTFISSAYAHPLKYYQLIDNGINQSRESVGDQFHSAEQLLAFNRERVRCLHRNFPITIGTAKHESAFFEEMGTTGYVNIRTVLSRCDDSTVKVRITKLYRPNESKEFEMSKAELSARKSAIVLAFNIEPLAYKIFYFQQSSLILRFFQRPLVDYQLEIECKYRPSGSRTQYYLIGSSIQLNGQNYINIPIYETEMLAFCEEDRIGLAIHNAEHERTTYIELTKELLLENDAFNINISNKTVQPILQGRNDPVLSSRTIVSSSRIPSDPSSSTTGQTESSTIATTHDKAITSSQVGKTESEVDEMESKQQSENNESVSLIVCAICRDRQREIVFLPCRHCCACPECSKQQWINHCRGLEPFEEMRLLLAELDRQQKMNSPTSSSVSFDLELDRL